MQLLSFLEEFGCSLDLPSATHKSIRILLKKFALRSVIATKQDILAFAGKLILESLFIDFLGKSGMVYRI